MSIRTPAIVSAALLAYMFAIAAWAWAQVPAGGRVAIHWNIQGQADRFAGREALFLSPAIALGIALLLALLPWIEPRRVNLARSARAYVAVWIAIMLLMAAVTSVVVLAGVGRGALAPPAVVIPVCVGLLLLVIGNYLGKIRSNYFFGVRTPWTLSSEVAWNKTHRLAARVFVAWGLLLVVSSPLPWLAAAIVVGGAALTTVGLFGYSYLVWRSDPAKQRAGRHPLTSNK